MEVIFVFLIILGVVAGLGNLKGRTTAKKVILLIDEKDNEWKKRGLKDEEIKKHLQKCVNIINSIKIRDYTEKELLTRCRLILDDEEKFINFD